MVSLLLSACGGGGDDGASNPAPGTAATAPGSNPSAATSFTLAGTAATGAAIAGGAVTAHCTVGTANASTAADGTFTLVFDQGQVAPCLLRVTTAGPPAVELYGFAASAGHVDITTLTDSALTRALAASPADVFAGFDLARATAINTALPAAIAYLQSQFSAARLGSVPADLMTASFVVGDTYDKLLDGIGAAFLGAGHTYADFINQVKLGADLITIVTPAAAASTDITPSPVILALPLTGKVQYLKTAADLAGFNGSHVFGRGVRSAVASTTNLLPPFSAVSGCKLAIEGNEFVFSASGQTTRVSMTPFVGMLNGVEYPSSYATVYPRNAYGNTLTMTLVNAPDANGKNNALSMTIENGVVTDAGAIDGPTGTETSCGTSTGGNLNTDRSSDALTLPTALVTELKTSAIAKGGFIGLSDRAVVAADTAGFAAKLNFGRGVYSTYNADFTVKDVLRVTDCKAEIVAGVLRLSSAQAGYDHSFTLDHATFQYQVNADKLLFTGRESADVTSPRATVNIDGRTSVPTVTSIEASSLVGAKLALMACPRG